MRGEGIDAKKEQERQEKNNRGVGRQEGKRR